MKKRTFFFTLGIVLAAQSAFAQSSAVIREYVEMFKDAAIAEMIRTGVPASITLAQGIHETDAGRSVLVQKSNNHFGIKCKKEWTGESVSHDDDAKGECFRKYTNAIDSYRDHSDFLRNRSHYAFLFELDPADYEAWAWGLKKAGYATNPKYPQILIKLIKEYHLNDYTLIAMGRKNEVPARTGEGLVKTDVSKPVFGTSENENIGPAPKQMVYPQGVFKINETSVVYVPKGTAFLALAEEHRINLSRLFDFNDMQPIEIATEDGLIFLQRKRRNGANETHTVASGETLHSIAQAEGIRLDNLLDYNDLKAGMQPAVGELLYLKNEAPSPPRLSMTIFNKTPEATNNSITEHVNTNTAAAYADEYIMHVVQPKETVYSIAKRYSVNMNDVLKWNDLPGSEIKTGQQLRIKKKV